MIGQGIHAMIQSAELIVATLRLLEEETPTLRAPIDDRCLPAAQHLVACLQDLSDRADKTPYPDPSQPTLY